MATSSSPGAMLGSPPAPTRSTPSRLTPQTLAPPTRSRPSRARTGATMGELRGCLRRGGSGSAGRRVDRSVQDCGGRLRCGRGGGGQPAHGAGGNGRRPVSCALSCRSAPAGATSRTSSWSVSRPAKVRLVRRATTSTCEALRELLREVRPTEADAVDDVPSFAQRELGVSAVRDARPDHGQARDTDERRRLPGGLQRCQLAARVRGPWHSRSGRGR